LVYSSNKFCNEIFYNFRHFIKILKLEQKSIDADLGKFIIGEEPPPKIKKYRDADACILRILNRYHPINVLPQNHDHNYIHPLQNAQPIIELLRGISHKYEMNQ